VTTCLQGPTPTAEATAIETALDITGLTPT